MWDENQLFQVHGQRGHGPQLEEDEFKQVEDFKYGSCSQAGKDIQYRQAEIEKNGRLSDGFVQCLQ